MLREVVKPGMMEMEMEMEMKTHLSLALKVGSDKWGGEEVYTADCQKFSEPCKSCRGLLNQTHIKVLYRSRLVFTAF